MSRALKSSGLDDPIPPRPDSHTREGPALGLGVATRFEQPTLVGDCRDEAFRAGCWDYNPRLSVPALYVERPPCQELDLPAVHQPEA
jgi:hypothetical protein